MSRLVFKEVIEVPLEEYNEMEKKNMASSTISPSAKNQSSKEGEKQLSSYQLFDLTSDAESSSKVQIKSPEPEKPKQNMSTLPPNKPTLIEISSDDESEIQHRATTPQREVPAQEIQSKPLTAEAVFANTTVVNPPVSTFLTKFLSKKRASLDVEPPPIEPSNEVYLKQFHEQYQSKKPVASVVAPDRTPQPENGDPNESAPELSLSTFIVTNEGLLTNEDAVSEDSDIMHKDNDNEEVDSNADSTDNLDTSLIDEENLIDLTESTKPSKSSKRKKQILTVHIYNLPYEATVEDVEEFLLNCGVKPKSVVLGTGNNNANTSSAEKKPSNGMPLGSAVVEFQFPKSTGPKKINKTVDKINGKLCGNRFVRAQKVNTNSGNQSANIRKRLSFGKEFRYFDTKDISCKCNNCGEIGHRAQDCVNPPLPQPCHFCAGKDHDASDCPNIICYRCGTFGHHSRDCTNGQRARPVICFECGATTHDVSRCHDFDHMLQQNENIYESKVEGSWIKCMICQQSGHGLCKKLPKPELSKDSYYNVYCPNCGEKGHHSYYRPFGRKTLNYQVYDCIIPKCEAFNRYPQLQRDVETLLEKDYDYYEFVQRKDENQFPIFTARNIKPAHLPLSSYHKDWIDVNDSSSEEEEEEAESSESSLYFHEEVDDEVEENEEEDDDNSDSDYEDGEDDQELSGKRNKKRKRSTGNNPNQKNHNNNNSNSTKNSNKKHRSELKNSNKKKGKKNKNKNTNNQNNSNNSSNYYNNYNNGNNNNNNSNRKKQRRDGEDGEGTYQSHSGRKFDKRRDQDQPSHKRFRRDHEDRSSIRDYDGVYFASTNSNTNSKPSSSHRVSDHWNQRK